MGQCTLEPSRPARSIMEPATLPLRNDLTSGVVCKGKRSSPSSRFIVSATVSIKPFPAGLSFGNSTQLAIAGSPTLVLGFNLQRIDLPLSSSFHSTFSQISSFSSALFASSPSHHLTHYHMHTLTLLEGDLCILTVAKIRNHPKNTKCMWISMEKAEEMWITYREDHGCVVRVPRALE
jgi:hypothetical protein